MFEVLNRPAGAVRPKRKGRAPREYTAFKLTLRQIVAECLGMSRNARDCADSLLAALRELMAKTGQFYPAGAVYHRGMTQHTITEAAILVGRDRKTLYRAIKEGRLNATLSATGQKQVDTSELLRVFGELKPASDRPDSRATVAAPQRETPDATARMALLEVELRHARELLAEKDAQIQTLNRALLLLENSAQEQRRGGFFDWLR